MLLMALWACAPSTIEPITGRIGMGPGASRPPAQGATVRVLDVGLETFDEVQVGQDGRFEATGLRGETVFVEIFGDGLTPVGFIGHVGQGPLEVPDGELFAWPQPLLAELQHEFGDCAQGDGGSIHGELRLFGATDEQGQEPLITTGFASIDEKQGCYLDDHGVYDPAATVTGATGTYAFFGVEPGVHTLHYGYFVTPDFKVEADLAVYVPEDGISAQFPAYLDLYLGD